MLFIATAVLIALVEAQTAHTAEKKATAARKKAATALEAKALADEAAEKARAELERVRVQTAEQLAACQEQAQTSVRTELEEARTAAEKAVAEAQEAAEKAIQQAIADRDRILDERATDMRQQIEQAKADAQARIEAIQHHDDGEQPEASGGARPAGSDQAMKAQQHGQTGSAAARPDLLTGRGSSKMTPQLIDKAQRMYDSGRYTVAEIAQSCGVSPTTIYRHIDTGS